jgi:hypothetical protein
MVSAVRPLLGDRRSDSDIVKLTLWTRSRLSGRPFQNFNFAVVDLLGDLGEIAQVEPLQAGRAFHEMIGLIFGDAICVGPGLRH